LSTLPFVHLVVISLTATFAVFQVGISFVIYTIIWIQLVEMCQLLYLLMTTFSNSCLISVELLYFIYLLFLLGISNTDTCTLRFLPCGIEWTGDLYLFCSGTLKVGLFSLVIALKKYPQVVKC